MTDFLEQAGWSDAVATPIAGDASARRYARLTKGADSAILMQDPDGDIPRFCHIARHLLSIGLSAPRILAEAPDTLLLEDLGDRLIARLATDPQTEQTHYLQATDALIALHAHPPPSGLSVATPTALAQATDLAAIHYAALPELAQPLAAALEPVLAAHAMPQAVCVLRDYHAENILDLPGRAGPARAGLLDFQDALVGHRAYDLASLIFDVRRDLFPGTAEACIQHYCTATETDRTAFDTAIAVLSAQRNLRILGVFARLAALRGKPGYLSYLPRTWAHVMTALAHPVLAPVRAVVDQLPPPTPAYLDTLAQRAGGA